LIPTEKLKRILVESAKARLYSESRTLVCTSCWDYCEIKTVKDIGKVVECPKCQSRNVGLTTLSDNDMRKILDKKGAHLSEYEKAVITRATETGKLVGKHGQLAVIALSGRRVSPEQAIRIVRSTKRPSDRFFEMILEAERESLKERFL
jgi:ATP-dependent Lhr-like helicase